MSYLESVGDPADVEALKTFLDQMSRKDSTDYHVCFQAFSLVGKIMNSLERIEDGTAALCRELVSDGVHYVELRTGIKSFNDCPYEDYVKAFLRGADKGCKGSSLEVKWLLSLKRNSSKELTNETLRLIKEYRQRGVVGIDISDDALLGDGSNILDIMKDVEELQIPIALHLGECRDETEEQQLRELNLLKPSRIGHGVFLCDKAKEIIFKERLPIEMCLSSAVQAHMVEKPQDHPALDLLKSGYPVVICTDDPLIFNTSHTTENELAMNILGYSLDQMKQLHDSALQHSFSD